MVRSFLIRGLSRLFNSLTPATVHNEAIESLEQRRMLSTTMVYDLNFESYDPPYIASGVTDTYYHTTGGGIAAYFEESALPATFADSFTIMLDDLPAHTMIRASWSVGPYVNIADSEDVDGFTMVAAGKTGIVTIDENGYGGSGNAGGWTAHSGDSATFSLTANNLEWDDGLQFERLKIELYNPTVSLAGEGTTIEDDSARGAFTLQRDLPTGFNPTYHDPIPSTTVGLEVVGGTATAGVDFTLATSATIPQPAATSQPVEVVPIDDLDAEGIETIFASVVQPANGQIYLLAAVPATAPATNPTTQKVELDDDVSIKSVAIHSIAAPNGQAAVSNGVGGFTFYAAIIVTGERVDRIDIRQDIQADTNMWQFNGDQMTDAQVLTKQREWHGENLSEDGLNTGNVFKPDPQGGWDDWKSTLEIHPDSKKGVGLSVDIQGFGMGVGTDPNGVKFSYIASVTRTMKTRFKNRDTGNEFAPKTWGFTWSNSLCTWTNTENPAPPAGIVVCAGSNKNGGKGKFNPIDSVVDLINLN